MTESGRIEMFNEKEYMRSWKKNNTDKVRKYAKRYLKKNPWAKYKALIASRCSWSPYYNGEICLRKNLITTAELKKLWFRDKAYLLKQPSIDRIDNDGDYTYDNCRFIEMRENRRLGGLNSYKYIKMRASHALCEAHKKGELYG